MPSPHRAITGGSGKIRCCRCLTINETRCLVWCRVQGKGRVGLFRDDGEVGLPRFCFCVCFCFCAPFRVRLVCPILIRLYLLLDFPHYTHATIHNTSAARAPTCGFLGLVISDDVRTRVVLQTQPLIHLKRVSLSQSC